jgi:calcineurin-like phosphoesterase family protein
LIGTIILIHGNHDRKSFKFYEKIGFKVLTNAPIILEKYKLMLSHVPLPDSKIKEGYINLHGHIHNKSISEDYSDEKHINLSVDVTGYKPVSIDEDEDYIKKKIEYK